MDYASYPELDLSFAPIDGPEESIQTVIRSRIWPTGACWWAPDATLGLREQIAETSTDQDMRSLCRQLSGMFSDHPTMDVVTTCERKDRTLYLYDRIVTEAGQRTATYEIDAEGILTLTVS